MSEHVFDRLSAYLDDELSAAERERFRGHLASCSECARRLEGLAEVDGALRDLPEQAPAGYFEALPGRIRSRLAAAEAPARTAWRVPAWALATAAALVVGVLAPLTLLKRPAQEAPPSEAFARMLEPGREAPLPQAKAVAAPTTLPPMALSVPATGRPPDARAERLESATRARQSRLEQDTLRADAIVAEAAPPRTSPPAPAAAANGRAETPEGQPSFARPPQPAAPKLAEQRVAQEAEPRKQEPAQAEAAVATASPERRAKEQVAGFADPEDQAAADRLGKTDERGSASGRAKGTQLADGLFTFPALLARSPRDASEARALREAWRRLASELAAAAEADEARVRVLDMGAAAWRFERLAEDRALLEKDVAAYLARQDARQAPRVRALRDGLSR